MGCVKIGKLCPHPKPRTSMSLVKFRIQRICKTRLTWTCSTLLCSASLENQCTTDFWLLPNICCFGSAEYHIGYIGKPIFGIFTDMISWYANKRSSSQLSYWLIWKKSYIGWTLSKITHGKSSQWKRLWRNLPLSPPKEGSIKNHGPIDSIPNNSDKPSRFGPSPKKCGEQRKGRLNYASVEIGCLGWCSCLFFPHDLTFQPESKSNSLPKGTDGTLDCNAVQSFVCNVHTDACFKSYPRTYECQNLPLSEAWLGLFYRWTSERTTEPVKIAKFSEHLFIRFGAAPSSSPFTPSSFQPREISSSHCILQTVSEW